MEIKKIEKSDFVMFPRMQHRGLEFRHVERDAFKAELRHVEGHGDYLAGTSAIKATRCGPRPTAQDGGRI